KIDPLLFSPAAVQLVNVETGNSHHFGAVCPEVLQQSFGAE
ncbi:MAG: methenyltetrahydromethanopterin cyclohydrolase, partial [Planctomycetaceae bacterium]|nr:methenyltetrahydromethanopterin cyclohydrolase [Planctomycetaceae bacterium]